MFCSRLRAVWPALLLGFLGCAGTPPEDEGPGLPDPKTFVPVHGTVTLEGKPLAHAIVTFLPNQAGLPGNGETDENGKYELTCMESPGVAPGSYKVAVSYLLSADGVPQGMGPRSAIAQPPGMLTAKEQLLPEIADLGRTKLKATVESKGGNFDFQVERNPAVTPPAAKPAAAEPKPAAAEPKPAPAPAAEVSTPKVEPR